MPRAIVGTFKVGSGVRVGQNSLDFVAPKLRLRGKQFSLGILEGAEVVLIPTRPRMRLQGRSFSLSGDQKLTLPSARLHLAGRAYSVVVPVGPTYPQRPLLRLHGGSFPLSISQSLAFQRPLLRLVPGMLLRVGVPGLIPTVPETIVLTPSPVEVGLLVPTTVEVGELLTPSPVRNV